MDFYSKFGKKAVIGMIHLLPLPGSPKYGGDLEAVYKAAQADLLALKEGGINAAIIENFGDIPYGVENEIITLTALSSIAARLREKSDMVLGVNVQFNDIEAEWAITYSCSLDFLRAEAFVENRVGVHGVTYAAAPKLGRLRGRYPKDALILADINTKHTFPLCPQPIEFSVHEAIASGADALIVTGLLTGQNPTIEQVSEIKAMAGDFPVILGSGVNENNIAQFFEVADGAIIGSSIKYDGDVFKGVDPKRVASLMAKIK